MPARSKTPPSELTKTVARNIKVARIDNEITQVELANLLTGSGYNLGFETVRAIEQGRRKVTVDDLVHLGRVLGVSPVDLLRPAREYDYE